MKKRNKKYNPSKHRADPGAAFRVVQLSKPVSDEAKDKLNEQIHGALEAFTKGVAVKEHFDILASTVDVVFMMAMNLFDNAYQDEINASRQAMFRAKDRYVNTEKFGFDGKGYNAIKVIVAIHDEMMNHVTGAEVLQFMNARANAIKGGNYYKGCEKKAA
jgi:hypothetical protein